MEPDKLAAFNAMTHHLVHIPLGPYNFQTESNIMKQLAFKNDVNIDIDRLVQKKLSSHLLNLTTVTPQSPSSHD